MVAFRSLALLAAASLLVKAQDITSLEPCAQTCYNQMLTERAATFGCGPGELNCLCGKPDFAFGVRDCATATCAEPGIKDIVFGAVQALCATATVPVNTPAPTPAPEPAPTTSAPPPPTSSPSSGAISSAPSSTTGSGSAAGLASTTHTSTHSNPTASPTVASGTKSTTSTTSTPTSGASASNPSAKEEGLATTTKVGIGIGVAAGVAVLVGVAACIYIRRQNRPHDDKQTAKHWKISEPMPGAGRTFAGDSYNQEYEMGISDLEMKSRRYEDMVPRQTPRHMV